MRPAEGHQREQGEPREDICVIKHGLRIPQDADGYDDFAEQMKAAEREFLKPFAAR